MSYKVKCKICKLKGFYDDKAISEFWASRFLRVAIRPLMNMKSNYICRNCISDIIDALKYESNRIDDLYKPKIKISKSYKKPVRKTKFKRGKNEK